MLRGRGQSEGGLVIVGGQRGAVAPNLARPQVEGPYLAVFLAR